MKIEDKYNLKIEDKYKIHLNKKFAKEQLEKHTQKNNKEIPFDAISQNAYVISKNNKLPSSTLGDFLVKKK